jgi:hypothetical protein
VSALFASGHIVDAILVMVALEAAVLLVLHRRTGRGLTPGAMLSTLASGVFLMLALRCALTGAWWGFTGAAMGAGGIAHVVDLRRRWK